LSKKAPTPAQAKAGSQRRDILKDWEWIMSQISTETFKAYSGKYVAVIDRCIVGSGGDAQKRRNEIGHQRGLDPERVAVMFID
jgi:hypothetical protein